MWNTEIAIVLTFYLLAAFNLPNSERLAYGQIGAVDDSSGNKSISEFITNNNTSAMTSHNDTRIMENTSGMLDEAFGAIKDSFNSLFEK